MYSKSFKNWLYAYIKIFLLFFFFSSHSLNASVLSLPDHFTKTLASPYMEFTNDINNTYTIQHINEMAWKKVTSSNLSAAKLYPTWTRFSLQNDAMSSKNIILQNPRAGMDQVDVYIFRQNRVDKIMLGDQRPLSIRDIPDRYSTFALNLNPNETVTIVTRLVNTIGSTEGEWVIYSEGAYHKYDVFEMLWWGVFGGTTLALLAYAIPTLLAVKDFYLGLYFTLFALSSLMYQYSINGLVYFSNIPIFWINRIVLFFGISFGLFTALLLLRFLKMANKRGKIFWAASFFSTVMIFELLILFLGIFDQKIMQIAGLFNAYFAIFAYLTWFAMFPDILKLTLDRVFVYFFIGYTFIIAAYSLQALMFAGILEINFMAIYGVSAASLAETFCFLLGISLYIKNIENDQKKKDKLIDFQMRFASIGKVIGNIAHQWKVPLVRSGTLLTELETTLLLKKESIAHRLEEILPQMKSNLQFMQETVDEFYNLYSVQSKTAKFRLNDTIMEIWTMLHAKTIKCNASIILSDEPEDISIVSYAHSLSHVSMIILDNFLNISEEREIKEPQLTVTIQEQNDQIKMIFDDNCGGIRQKPIASIFNLDVSSKNSEMEVGGMGLAMAKILVEEKLKGSIEVQNSAVGTRFLLFLPKTIN